MIDANVFPVHFPPIKPLFLSLLFLLLSIFETSSATTTTVPVGMDIGETAHFLYHLMHFHGIFEWVEKYLLSVAYNGSHFHGVTPNPGVPTIMSHVQSACEAFVGKDNVEGLGIFKPHRYRCSCVWQYCSCILAA